MRQHSFVKEPMCPQCVHISPSSNVNASSRTLNTKQMFWHACSGEIGNMTALWSFYILLDKASVQKNMFISYILVEPCLALFTKNLGQLHQLTSKKKQSTRLGRWSTPGVHCIGVLSGSRPSTKKVLGFFKHIGSRQRSYLQLLPWRSSHGKEHVTCLYT